MSTEKFGRYFGDSKLIGDCGEEFFKLPAIDQARAQGWSNGCPVVERLVKPAAEGGRGAEAMTKSYGRANFMLGYLSQLLSELNRSDLALLVLSPRERKAGEVMGTHDEGWPPEELSSHIFNTAIAYALPRLFNDYVDSSSGEEEGRDNFHKALEYFESASNRSSTDIELGVHFASYVVTDLISQGKRKEAGLMLRHLLSAGKLKEDNQVSTYKEIFAVMKNVSPFLYGFYELLTAQEKADFRMIDEVSLT